MQHAALHHPFGLLRRLLLWGVAPLLGGLLPACAPVLEVGAPDVSAPDLSAPVCAAPQPAPASGCAAWHARGSVGKLPSPLLTEISGVAVSRKNSTAQTRLLWLHNDSGDTPRLFAVAVGAAAPRLVATYNLTGVTADDWEDIAIGPVPGRSGDFLYIGDIGNNFDRSPRRTSIRIYRIPEPTVDLGKTDQQIDVAGAERIDLAYPDGKPFDSEAFFVEPQSGEITLLTKDVAGGPSYALRVPPVATPMGPLTPVVQCPGAPRALSFPGGKFPAITSASISPAGDAILVRAYTGAFLWSRLPGESVATALGRQPCALPVTAEAQGEAIGVGPDGTSYYTISEGAGAEINGFQRD